MRRETAASTFSGHGKESRQVFSAFLFLRPTRLEIDDKVALIGFSNGCIVFVYAANIV